MDEDEELWQFLRAMWIQYVERKVWHIESPRAQLLRRLLIRYDPSGDPMGGQEERG